LHRNCHLAVNASQILTTNLFVAQALRGAKVRLLGGEWDLRTGALVNCADKPARLEQYLSARARRPDVALLSFESLPGSASSGAAGTSAEDLELVTEDCRESQLKMAAFGATRLAVFVLIAARNIGRPAEGETGHYPLSRLLRLQRKTPYSNRDVYLVTDLEQPTEDQRKILDWLARRELQEHRIWLISPALDTRPHRD
jgi:hypothetical protein